MKYENLLNNNEVVLDEDRKLSFDDLVNLFLHEITSSSLSIISFKRRDYGRCELTVKLESKIVKILFFLKNITGAGWAKKPEMKRVQIPNLNNLEDVSNSDDIETIIGLYAYNDNPLIVCWDSYHYLNHATQRSCYINIDTLKLGYEYSYYSGVVSSQVLWCFKGTEFGKFIINYIDYINRVDGRK